jgi:GTP-binding protein YchF
MIKIGIIGLPNVGKSTLFSALTNQQVDISNYPFCTIDPNVGVVAVPDARLDSLARALNPDKVLPTTVEFVDIAGLVEGAHKGEGLGNRFLAHIREVDAVAEVLRSFSATNIAHPAGRIDPLADKETIALELAMADLETVNKQLTKAEREAKSGDREAARTLAVLGKIKNTLEQGQAVGKTGTGDDEQNFARRLNLLTAKPILYVINADEPKDPDVKLPTDGHYIPVNARLELEMSELSATERNELELESELDSLIRAVYGLLDIITFYTVQNKILQAWTIPRDTKTPAAAGRIHTDFESGFIRAEVIAAKRLVEAGSEQAARSRGWIRTEGRDCVVQDGDVCRFLHK